MKLVKMCCLIGATALLGGAGAVAQMLPGAPQQQGQPSLQLSQEVWDFGRVWFGQPVETQVTLTNTGSAPLLIRDVKSSCGCTVAKPNKTRLAPGESDAMTVTYDSTQMKKDVKQNIRIETNDPRRPQVTFSIKGEVWHVFDVEPKSTLAFGLVLPDTMSSQSVVLSSNLGERAQPKIMEETVPSWATARLDEVRGSENNYRVTVTLQPPLPHGKSNHKLGIATGVPQLPRLDLKLFVSVSDAVAVRPDTLWLLPARAERPTSRQLYVCYLPEIDLNVTNVETNNPNVSARVVDRSPKPFGGADAMFVRQIVRVNLPAYTALPQRGVEITIHTDHPDAEYRKLVVPINVGRPTSTDDELEDEE